MHAWAHRWWRDRAHRDRRAIAARSKRAEDRHRAGAANDVSQVAWASNNARLEGEHHGWCKRREELRFLRRGWGWAENGTWIVPQWGRKGSISLVWPREGHRSQVQTSIISRVFFVPAGPSQLCSSTAVSSATTMKHTKEMKWHSRVNGVVQTTCSSMWVRQRRLWWASGETLVTSPHWPSTARLWRESAALNSWGCTSQRTSPAPPTHSYSLYFLSMYMLTFIYSIFSQNLSVG